MVVFVVGAPTTQASGSVQASLIADFSLSSVSLFLSLVSWSHGLTMYHNARS